MSGWRTGPDPADPHTVAAVLHELTTATKTTALEGTTVDSPIGTDAWIGNLIRVAGPHAERLLALLPAAHAFATAWLGLSAAPQPPSPGDKIPVSGIPILLTP